MSDCLSEDSVVELVEGRLSPEVSAQAHAHLARCDDCRVLVAAAADGLLETAAARHDAQGSALLAPGTLVDRYRILELAGRGAMGAVYAAYDPDLDRRVAIKLLRTDLRDGIAPAELRNRLLREAQAMARLAHANVVAVHDVGTWKDAVFVAMDFVDGVTLRDWLSQRTRPWQEVLDVLVQAGRGLAAAHRASLVHRDFKPDNVLIGRDGVARVTDFGLARSAVVDGDAPPEPDGGPGSPLAQHLTRTGALVGTPAYMSPEQLAGAASDARSDMFNYCATAYYALYGELPFPTEDLTTLRAAVERGQVREAPRSARIPQPVRRALLRGLHADPAQRHPSMEALLSALSADRRRTARVLVAAGAALAAAVAAVLIYRAIGAAPPCVAAEGKLSGVWDDVRKGTVRESFRRTARADADAVFAGVAGRLDAYARAWVAARVEACEATHVRHEQSAALLDARMRCLDGRLRELGALAEAFSDADAKTVERALPAAYRLRSLEACSDAQALSARLPPPADPAAVDRVRADVARARALGEAGKLPAAIALARDTVARARALAYRPLEAEALLQQGALEKASSDGPGAEASLRGATLAAEASRHDEVSAEAQIQLVGAVGWLGARVEEGLRWADFAEAAIQRLGGSPLLDAALAIQRGDLLSRTDRIAEALAEHAKALSYWERHGPGHPQTAEALVDVAMDLSRAGRYPEALDRFRRAHAIREALFGPEHVLTAKVLGYEAIVLRRLGRLVESAELQRRAFTLQERALGADHPAVASTLINLGNVLDDLGRPGEARVAHERALAIRKKVLEPGHPEVANVHLNLGNALLHEGRNEEALAHFRTARLIFEQRFGPESRPVAISLSDAASALLRLGRVEEAIAHAERARVLFEKVVGAAHPELGEILDNLGHAALEQLRFTDARAHFERAVAVREKALGPRHPLVGASLTGVGLACLGMKEPARARPVLERAATLMREAKVVAGAVSEAEFALAQALWEEPAERARARRLAHQAGAALASATPFWRRLRGRIATWLRAR